MADLFDAVAARALGLAPVLRPAPSPRFAGSADAPVFTELDVETERTAPASRGTDRATAHPAPPDVARTRRVSGDREGSTAQPASGPRPAVTPLPAGDPGRPAPVDATVTAQSDDVPGSREHPEQVGQTEGSGQTRLSPAPTPRPPRPAAGPPYASAAAPVEGASASPEPAAATRDPAGRPGRAGTHSARGPQAPRRGAEEQETPAVGRRRRPHPDSASDREESRRTGGRTNGTPATPSVTVSIGHVEVRVHRPAPPPAATRRPTRRAEPRLSLQDYLRQGPAR